VRFAFTEDQLLFRDTVRDFLFKECPPDRVREAWENESGHLADVWAGLASIGVTGLRVPESAGGLGLTDLDLVLLLEETGRTALPGPVIDTVAVAPPLLSDLPEDVGGAALSGIADGSMTVATGFASGLVPNADIADLLVLVRDDDLVIVGGSEAMLVRQASIDGARRLFEVSWSRDAERAVATGDQARRLIEQARDRGAVAASAQLLGLADRMLEMTVGYVQERRQFGVPIGSFQAVKHRLANALLAVSFARPVVYNAAYSAAHGLSSASRDASMAKVFASDAARRVAKEALQCHGAIGYTVEYDLQLFMKRAWSLAASWGDAAMHRDRVATALGI